MRTRFVWLLVGISGVCLVGDTVVVAAFQPLLSEATIAVHGWPLLPLASLGSAVMGALIVTTYPRHPIGWLLGLVGATTSVSVFGEACSIWILEEGGPGPHWVGQLAGWVAALLGGPLALAVLAVMFLLAPDGRLLSPRWRVAVGAAVTGLLLFLAGLANQDPDTVTGRAEPGEASTLVKILTSLGGLLILAALLAAVASMVLRLRRAHGDTRQQLRWFATAAALLGVGILWLLVGQAITNGEQTWGSALGLQLSFFFLPICLAVAVLRYRLYDVDVIINRAVVVGLATLFVAAGYIALVVGVGELLGARSGDRFWLSVLATAVVAMAFQPLRKGVVRFADRLAYGTRAAPYDALSEFSRQLGESPAPEALLPAVAEAAGRAVSAHEVRVMLDVEHGAPPTAVWAPQDVEPLAVTEEDLVMLTISDRTGRLGEISVRLPPGRAPRPQELLLLDGLAEQAALAFRNARLQAELAAHVTMLDERTAQLAASRRRLFETGDAERRRLEAAIAREVMPTLERLAGRLDRACDGNADTVDVDPLVDQATEALDSLRELTRGIFPTMLTRAGLAPALTSYFARLRWPGVLTVDESVTGRRFSARTEAAAYFCCVAAIPHGRARASLTVAGDRLVLEVTGAAHTSSDLAAMVDRVEALGGTLEVLEHLGDDWLLVQLPATAAESAPLLRGSA